MKSLYLVDISSFIFRAYYAIRPLSTKEGIPVNAVFGVVSMINRLIESKKPDHLIVCNDRAEKGFRHEIFPKYKANRDAPPEDLVPQFDLIKEFIRTYPILAIDKKGYEADDIIASLVERYKNHKDMQIFIVSSDKDLMQLIGDNVFMYDTMKDKIFKKEDVVEKFGVGPDKVVDVQSLCGDTSDNIPGISGVGPKTASKLISEFGDLDSVLNNAEKINGKVGEKIASEKEMALTSKKLVSLVRNLDMHINWDDMQLSKPNACSLNVFYRKLEFNKFILAEDGKPLEKSEKISRAEFILIDDVDSLEKIAHEIKVKKIKRLAFDTETDSIDAHQANLVGFSFCYDSNKAFYVALGHKNSKNIALADFKKIFLPILTDETLGKVAQNAKFDLNVLFHHDILVKTLTDDTLVGSYLCNPEGQHNLDFLADKYFSYITLKFSDVVPKGKTFADIDTQTAAKYSAEDAWMAFCLAEKINAELEKTDVKKIYQEIEMPLVPVLARMEQNGVLVDEALLDDLKQEFTQRLTRLEEKIYDLAGEKFNINSPKQLSVILFEKLKLPVVRKTKTGNSTDVDVLTELAKEHELPSQLVQYRILAKLLSTYVEQLRTLIHPKTRRVHTHFNQTIAATGRLSSTEPNLQNIPIKTEEGKRIRHVFIAPPGHILMSADYSQIELRLLADFSGDPHLIEAYQKNQDIHARTASYILGIDLDQVDDKARTIGKTINFGVIYGQSPFGLSKQLDVPMSEAKHFIDRFYREFHRVWEYKQEELEKATQLGFVTTRLGRKRFLPDLHSQNKLARQNAERAAFNTIFQGSAADLIKKAMILIDEKIQNEQLKTKMILQVHDELIFEVPQDEKDIVKKFVVHIMETAFTLKVPLKVSCNIGKNWAEAH